MTSGKEEFERMRNGILIRSETPGQPANPWRKLSEVDPFVFDDDMEEIRRLNKNRSDEDTSIQMHLLPEPYIGNPHKAKVVLLNLNPGYDSNDYQWHVRPDFKTSVRRNLLHEEQDFPFYLLHPDFKESPGGQWWRKRLRHLLEKCGEQTIAQKLCVIEWFPYHSKQASFPSWFSCKSQAYSHWLVQTALRRNAFILLMRARRLWKTVLPELKDVPSLKNPRCAYVNPGNMEDDTYKRICDALDK